MLIFNPENHEYRLYDKVVPSVTQALNIMSDEIYANVSENVMRVAADRGSKVHKACELWDQGELDEEQLDPILRPYLEGWKKFLKETGFQVKFNESKVWSVTNSYAGTLDRVGDLNNKVALVDIKARARLTDETGPQLAAYKAAFEEINKKIRIRERWAVNLKNNGTYQMKQYTDREDYKDFLACLRLYRRNERYS